MPARTALLDWVFLRVSPRRPILVHPLSHVPLDTRRCIQQAAALVSRPPSAYPETLVRQAEKTARIDTAGSPVSELAHRVEALAVTAENEGIPSDPTYSEEELLAFYDDLLALPRHEQVAASSPTEMSQEEQDRVVVESILSRISPSPLPSTSSETFSTLLQRRTELTSHGTRKTQTTLMKAAYHRIKSH
ncbi:hypothetical protein BC826DRAFT_1103293 [Russula brevipes]|nr:hypothetical protein BC826DRAFT_1103293 [Russula brevipes]